MLLYKEKTMHVTLLYFFLGGGADKPMLKHKWIVLKMLTKPERDNIP